ncbi:MAG: T9SS C-terminal target domain-containing protein, partial [Bacteroidetes bacterium]
PVLTRVALVICAEANVLGKFQWYANGKLLPNETNRCLTISLSHFKMEANQTIIYTVIVVDEEGRESEISSPVEVTTDQINLITGIESDLEQNPIRVYPNPVKDRLVLDLSSKFLRKIEISIFNMLGQKVLTKSLTNSEKEEILDLNHLPAGTYLLEILSEKGKHRQQIVKE